MTAEFQPVTSGDFFLASLDRYMQRHGQGRHYGVTVLQCSTKPDLAVLSARWQRLHSDYPQLASSLKRSVRGWQMRWQALTTPLLAPPVCERVVGRDQWDGLIQERLQGLLERQPLKLPLYLEWLADPSTPGGALVLTWQHTRLDGAGVHLLLHYLNNADPPAPVTEAKPVSLKSAGSHVRLAVPIVNAFAEMHRVGCLSLWEKGMPQAGSPDYEVLELTGEQTQRVRQKCTAHCGELVQMPFYAAAAARALLLMQQRRGWSSPCVHIQLPIQPPQRAPGAVVGNWMRVLPLIMESEQMWTFAQAVAHVQGRYRHVLREKWTQAAESMMWLSQHLPVRMLIPLIRFMSCGQICSLFHSHTGEVLPGTKAWCGADLENVYTIPSVSTPPGFGLFFSEYDGRLTPVISWRGPLLTDEDRDALRAQLLADLGADA